MRAPRLIACGTILFLVVSPARGQDAAKFFADNCAPCHPIGGPPGVGPDLKDVSKRRDRAWLTRFILNPEEMAKTDAEAAALLKRFEGVIMPAADGITPEIADAILRYIETVSGSPAPSGAPTVTPAPSREPTLDDVAQGRALYEGRRRLAGGGAPCVSCHRLESTGGLGGGTLGPDLTLVHTRLGGTHGLSTWLGNPPTRVMRAIFRNSPLTDDETFAIVAMLGDTSAHQPPSAPRRTAVFVAVGGALTLAALAIVAVIWSGRLRAVRRPLVEGARHPAGGGR